MRHLIKTQILEVTTDSSAGAFGLQHKLSSIYYNVILPAIEKTFDRLAPANRIIYLDSISVDLGALTIESLEKTSWVVEFTELLSRELAEAILEQSVNFKKQTVIATIAGQWIYYMRHGHLPWNVEDTDGKWYDSVLEELATDYNSIESLRQLILTDERAVRRIVLLHTPVFLIHLTEVLTGKKQDDLIKWIRIIEKNLAESGQLIAKDNDHIHRVQRLWMQVLEYCASVSDGDVQDIVPNAILIKFELKQLKQLLEVPEAKPLMASLVPFIQKRQQKEAKPEFQQQEKKQRPTQSGEQQAIPEEGLFVKHAGLILLHPFLDSFFKILQLVQDGRFIDHVAQLKALSLLHFLATGSEQMEEHELVIPKLLCGYPLKEPVEKLQPSATETEEAEELLKAVIAQWSILKNTSVEALRESFLQRRGKLVSTTDNNYRLIVEPESLDILLDHIPWGLSMIKLPWMEQLLKVDWK